MKREFRRNFFVFWVCFRPKSYFSEDKRDAIEKKTVFYFSVSWFRHGETAVGFGGAG